MILFKPTSHVFKMKADYIISLQVTHNESKVLQSHSEQMQRPQNKTKYLKIENN